MIILLFHLRITDELPCCVLLPYSYENCIGFNPNPCYYGLQKFCFSIMLDKISYLYLLNINSRITCSSIFFFPVFYLPIELKITPKYIYFYDIFRIKYVVGIHKYVENCCKRYIGEKLVHIRK